MARNATRRRQGSAETPAVELGTSFFRQKYLFAFASQPEVRRHLRTQLIPDESARTQEILEAWTNIQPSVQALINAEPNIAETISVEEVPQNAAQQIEAMLDSDLLRKSFDLPTSVAVVEIDKLVAAQRMVDIEHIERLQSGFAKQLDFDAVAKICLSSERSMAPIQHLEVGANVHAFTSPSSDFRFLGAFIKENLNKDDLAFAQTGGVPVAAIIGFIGYGAYPVNVLTNGSRIVLNNGFHRLYALRSAGVTKVPVMVQQAHNVQLEFPPQVAGIPRDYLLGHPRPVLMKDFFEDDFTTIIKVKNRMKMVMLQVAAGQQDVPS